MNTNVRSVLFSGIVAAGAALGVAGWTGTAAADAAFCIGNTSQAMLAAQTLNEFGIVITEVADVNSTSGGPIVVRANNYYKNGAGSEWTSGIPGSVSLPGGKCYNVAMMSKFTQPGGASWTCDATNSSQAPNQITVTGFVMTESQFIQQGTMTLLAQPTQYNANAPVINCYGAN